MTDKIISYEGNYYSYSSRLFKFISIDNKEHYVNYETLMKKSSTIKKMTTLEFSQQKGIMDMKIEVSSEILKCLIEYIEHNKISNTKIDWKVFLNTCDYLSIDTEDLSKVLDLYNKIIDYNMNKMIFEVCISRRLSYLKDDDNYDSMSNYIEEITFLEDTKEDDLFPYYNDQVYYIYEELINYIEDDIDSTFYFISDEGRKIEVDKESLNKHTDKYKKMTFLNTSLDKKLLYTIVNYIANNEVNILDVDINMFLKACDDLSLNVTDIRECYTIAKKLESYNDVLVNSKIMNIFDKTKIKEERMFFRNVIGNKTYIPYFNKDTKHLLNKLLSTIIDHTSITFMIKEKVIDDGFIE